MKIDIWSDIMCPFCYIGKRNFEKALEQFSYKDQVTVQWHSFILQPDLRYIEGESIYGYLVKSKNLDYSQAVHLTQHVTKVAREAGLKFDFEKVIVANTFLAHRFTQLAAKYNLQNDAEELLFAAYFVDGKNIGVLDTLLEVGSKLGIDRAEVERLKISEDFVNEVQKDIQEASTLNIRGVPFFLIDKRYGISGAQPVSVFLKVLDKMFEERKILEKVEASSGKDACEDEKCA